MNSKKKVAIVFTGGTISMTVDEKVGAAIPTLSGEQIMSMVTNIDKVANVEVLNFDEIPGPHMTAERMMELKHYVNSLLEREDICGVVITHGTDSLEETAYFLDLTIDNEKPVIVTGAMRSSSELGYDGPSNLSGAVCTAISDSARNKGVLIVLNNEVIAASEATKTDTLALNTFQSITGGPLGVIDCNEFLLYKQITKRLINIRSKSPIIIEESRDIIFFPLKSIRDKCNIWISFNNLERYVKSDDKTIFYFKNKKEVTIDFSYYIIDNQVTRSLMLDYEVKKRRESL